MKTHGCERKANNLTTSWCKVGYFLFISEDIAKEKWKGTYNSDQAYLKFTVAENLSAKQRRLLNRGITYR